MTTHDIFICVTWPIHMCDTILSHVWHDSFICDEACLIHMHDINYWYYTTYSYAWHNSFICDDLWLIHMCDMNHSYDDLWHIHLCDMTRSHVTTTDDSFICVTCTCVWHESFIWWLMTCLFVWHDSFIRHNSFICHDSWLIHTCNMHHSCDMTRSYVTTHDAFICVTCHSYLTTHDPFKHVTRIIRVITWLIRPMIHVSYRNGSWVVTYKWPIRKCNMSHSCHTCVTCHSYVTTHDSFIRVTCIIRVITNVTHMNESRVIIWMIHESWHEWPSLSLSRSLSLHPPQTWTRSVLDWQIESKSHESGVFIRMIHVTHGNRSFICDDSWPILICDMNHMFDESWLMSHSHEWLIIYMMSHDSCLMGHDTHGSWHSSCVDESLMWMRHESGLTNHSHMWHESYVWWVMSHVSLTWVSWMGHEWSYERVMSHMWMNHESCLISMSHVTLVNASCHTCEWVMAHIWMSHESSY